MLKGDVAALQHLESSVWLMFLNSFSPTLQILGGRTEIQ